MSSNDTGGDFWSKAKKPEKSNVDYNLDPNAKPPMARWKKVLLYLSLSCFVVGALLLVFAPKIVSSFAPGLVASQAPKYIDGTVSLTKASLSWSGPQSFSGFKIRKGDTSVVECDLNIEGGLFDLATGGANLGLVTVSKAKIAVVRGNNGMINLSTLTKSSTPKKAVPDINPQPVVLPSDLNVRLEVRNLDFSYTDLAFGDSSKITLTDVDLGADVIINKPLALTIKSKSGGGSINVDLKLSNWEDGGKLRLEKSKIDGSFDISNLPTSILDIFVPATENRPNLRSGLGESVSVRADLKGTRDNCQASIAIQSSGLKALVDVAVKDEFITNNAPVSVEISGSSLRALVPSVVQALESTPDVSVEALPDISVRMSDVKIPFSKGEIKTLRGASASVDLGLSRFTGALNLDGVQKRFQLTPTKLSVRTADLSKSLEGSLSTDLVVDDTPGGAIRIGFSSAGLLNPAGMFNSAVPKDLRANVSVRNIATPLFQPFITSTGIDLQQDIGPSVDLSLEAIAGESADDTLPPTSVSMSITTRDVVAATRFVTSDRGVEFAADSTKIELKSAGRLLSRFVKPETGWSVNPRTGSAIITIAGAALPQTTTGSFEVDKLQLRSSIALDGLAVSRIGDATSAIQIRNAAATFGVASGRVTADVKSSMTINAATTELAATIDVPDVFVIPSTGSSSFLANPRTFRPIGKISLKGVPIDGVSLFLPQDDSDATNLISLIKGVVGESADIVIASQPDQSNGFGIGLNVRAPKISCDVSGRLGERDVALSQAKLGIKIDGSTVSSVIKRFAPDVKGFPSLSNTSKVDVDVGAIRIPLDADLKPVWAQAGSLSIAVVSEGRTLIEGLRVQDVDEGERDLGRIGFQGLKLNVSLPFQTLFGVGQPEARMLTASLLTSIIGPAQTSLSDIRLQCGVEIESGKPIGPLNLELALDRIDLRQLETMTRGSNLASTLLGNQLTLRSNIAITPDAKRDLFDFTTSTVELAANIESKGVTTGGPIHMIVTPQSVEIPKPATLNLKIDPSIANNLLQGDSKSDPPFMLTRVSAVSVTVESLALPRVAGIALNVNALVSAPEIRFVDNSGRELSLADTKFSVMTDNTAATKPIKFSIETKSLAVDALATTKPLVLRGTVDNTIGQDGVFQFDRGSLSFSADIKGVPTVLIDTLLNQKGVLVDLLGDTADVVASADKVPLKNASNLNGQQFSFNMSSARVSTSVSGSVADSVFSSSVPLRVSVVEITNALTQRYIGAVPVLKKLEKQSVQQAATISEQGLRIPIDSDMKKLNGIIVLDPGEVTYEVNPMLAKLLKDNAVRTSGIMGNKLQPAKIVFTNGIGMLERYSLPLGEFSVGFEGRVDLVSQKSEMVVWVPAAQLADAVTGQVTSLLSAGSTATSDSNTILSTLLEVVPNWPFKASGPLTSPASSLTLDTDRVFEDFKKNGGYKKLIERVGGSKIKELLKPKLPGSPTLPK